MPTPLHEEHRGSSEPSPNGYHDHATNGVTAGAPIIPGYEILSELGGNEWVCVYRARDTNLGIEVAIKIPRSLEKGSSTALQFVEAARIAAQLEHPGVPPIFDLGTIPDGRPFLAMKLVKGSTLADILSARPRPIADRIRFLSLFEQICQAIAYAHVHRTIHRDLKPHHVMIGSFGEVQVIGWGSTAKVGSEHPDGLQPGTPAYMPPEQARGEWKTIDARADVFALGGILTEILTGGPTFSGKSATEVHKKAAVGEMSEAFDRLDRCGEDVELIAIARRCLNSNPARRPADAGELALLISAYRGSLEERIRKTVSESLVAPALASEKARRRKAELAVVLVVGLFLIATGAFFWREDRLERIRQVSGNTRESNEKPPPLLSERDRAAIEKKARDAMEQRIQMIKKAKEQFERDQAAKVKKQQQEERTAPPPREVVRPEVAPVKDRNPE